MKRLFDLLVSALGLVFFAPCFIITGLLIKLNDKGEIFFKQKRVGKNRRLFVLYKFRTMAILNDAKEGIFIPGDISRITSVGKILRKLKIDELPQLINVLYGDMSIVGPRPEVEKWIAVYSERWEKILSVKPGITDNASIEFRFEEEILLKSANPHDTYMTVILPRKLDLYEEYIKNQSFIGDLKILVRTIFVLLFK